MKKTLFFNIKAFNSFKFAIFYENNKMTFPLKYMTDLYLLNGL